MFLRSHVHVKGKKEKKKKNQQRSNKIAIKQSQGKRSRY